MPPQGPAAVQFRSLVSGHTPQNRRLWLKWLILLPFRKLVRIAGLEPARITPLPPQSSASANSAICALEIVLQERLSSQSARIYSSRKGRIVNIFLRAERIIRNGLFREPLAGNGRKTGCGSERTQGPPVSWRGDSYDGAKTSDTLIFPERKLHQKLTPPLDE